MQKSLRLFAAARSRQTRRQTAVGLQTQRSDSVFHSAAEISAHLVIRRHCVTLILCSDLLKNQNDHDAFRQIIHPKPNDSLSPSHAPSRSSLKRRLVLKDLPGIGMVERSLFRAGFSRPKPFFNQQLNLSRWPQFCDHSVTSADVRLNVGAAGHSSTDSGDLKVAKVRIFSSPHSPKARSTALMERRRFSD
jgi:hypothetical protein